MIFSWSATVEKIVPNDPNPTMSVAALGKFATLTVSKNAKMKSGNHITIITPIMAKTPGTYLLTGGHGSPLGAG